MHFPPVRWHGQERRLWNRVWRRSCKDLPEERVRLRFLDWLLLEQAWPAGHIASERSLTDTRGQRTDLLCYNKKGEPAWLIECKAPSVRIGESASLQIARYNQVVQAPILCLTNGLNDHWYRTDGEALTPLDTPPAPAAESIETIREPVSYWIDRGFLGRTSSETLQQSLTDLCRELYHPTEAASIFYLDGDWKTDHLALMHDYRMFKLDRNRQLAIAILSDAAGSTWISALHNKRGTTTAMIQIPAESTGVTGGHADEFHYFLSDTNGRMPLSSICPDPLPLTLDRLLPRLDEIVLQLLAS